MIENLNIIEKEVSPSAFLAVISSMQQEIELRGQVSEESRTRFFNEEVTFAAESVDLSLVSEYKYRYLNGELYNEDGTAFGDIIEYGLIDAKSKTAKDGRAKFELDRRVADAYVYDSVISMMESDESNTVIAFSPYPDEAEVIHGKKYLKEFGYQPDRKLSFIQIYHKDLENNLVAETISIDNSDFSVYQELHQELSGYSPINTTDMLASPLILNRERPTQTKDQIIAKYDFKMSDKYQTDFLHGKVSDNPNIRNGWSYVIENREIIDKQIDLFEEIAYTRANYEMPPNLGVFLANALHAKNSEGYPLIPPKHRNSINKVLNDQLALRENSTAEDIRLIISYMHLATLRSRLNKNLNDTTKYESFSDEVIDATAGAIERMEEMIGCGGTISLLEQGDMDQIANTMFKDRLNAIWFYDKRMHCKKCDPSKEQDKKMCGPCGWCRKCSEKDTRDRKKFKV